MSHREHRYTLRLDWEGNRGSGTSAYTAYGREHSLSAPGKATIAGSSDANFRGDAARWNPEELLVASLSACHQLWYLHLAAEAGIAVLAYHDEPEGTMVEDPAHGGHFSRVVLRPTVTVRAGDDAARAASLHARAHHLCFIANSVNFEVACEPSLRMG
jgi:organic hydroperoxide reductase OsmC/OhrA